MSYKFDSIVSKSEANALKEMIFNRARKKKKSMTDDVQEDVMDVARESFVSANNPFSQIIENTPANKPTEDKTRQKTEEEIGFPIKKIREKVSTQNKLINSQITQATIENTMMSARENLSNKQSFMGALNFLNSQAAISLIRTRADKFEIIA